MFCSRMIQAETLLLLGILSECFLCTHTAFESLTLLLLLYLHVLVLKERAGRKVKKKKLNFLWNARVIQFSNETQQQKTFLEFQIKNQQSKRKLMKIFFQEKKK